MARVKSIFDAIVKTKVAEDQCTNFLVYLLDKLPKEILLDIIKTSGLKINFVDDIIDIIVQYPLETSRPDAVVEFTNGKYLILETKLYPDSFNKSQFINHHIGGRKEFGSNNVWCLFLSGDLQCPTELLKIKAKHFGKVGFISWKTLLELLNEKAKIKGFSNAIIINEFLIFAKHYKLGKLVSMNAQELKTFIENYQSIVLKHDSAQEYFNKSIEKLKDKIIVECEELVEKNDDELSDTLPCIYRTFDINKWHIKEYSGYVFFNIILKKVGIILTGYQDKDEMKKFLIVWNEKHKKIYKQNSNLISLTFRSYAYISQDRRKSNVAQRKTDNSENRL